MFTWQIEALVWWLQMTQRPHWRHRAALSGVLRPLTGLVHPSILAIDPWPERNATPEQRELMGYNMLVQTFMALNWCASSTASAACRPVPLHVESQSTH